MAERLDNELARRGLSATRSKAQQAIRSGLVRVNGVVCEKCGRKVSGEDLLEVTDKAASYVSRGGLKLEGAIRAWDLDLTGVCLVDIGSSTGGFTDCALRHGATRVIAIDVGTNQMAEALRCDPRVELHEQTDFRTCEISSLAEADMASIDVSFVSATLMVDRLAGLPRLAEVICLVKPQFECGARAARAHRGIIRDESLRQEAITRVRVAFEAAGFSCAGVIESPITGGDGNVEYLARFVRKPARAT